MQPPVIETPGDAVRVTDLKNYAHCPRIPYLENCLRDVRPRTYMMDAGEEAHVEEKARARRRTLWAYGLPEGERAFAVRVYSPVLNLIGVIDELVRTPDGRCFPVDYKLSERVSAAVALQIGAYGMLVETQFGVAVPTGYAYLIERRELHAVAIDTDLRRAVREACMAVHEMVALERLPGPPRARSQCRACEWRRFCNDVV